MGNWKRNNFEPLEDWWKITSGPGCYAIYCDGQLIYIGQSANVLKRINSYKINYGYSNTIYTPWGCCSDLYVKVRKSKRRGDWLMVEYRMIARLRPKFNCVGGDRKRNTPIDRYTQAAEQS